MVVAREVVREWVVVDMVVVAKVGGVKEEVTGVGKVAALVAVMEAVVAVARVEATVG